MGALTVVDLALLADKRGGRWVGHATGVAALLLVGLSGVVLLTLSAGQSNAFQLLSTVTVGGAALGIGCIGWHARIEFANCAAAVVRIADLRRTNVELRVAVLQIRQQANTDGGSTAERTPQLVLVDGPKRATLHRGDQVDDLERRLRLDTVDLAVTALVRAGRPIEALALREATARAGEALQELKDALSASRGDRGEAP
jgi:hypothetical protein